MYKPRFRKAPGRHLFGLPLKKGFIVIKSFTNLKGILSMKTQSLLLTLLLTVPGLAVSADLNKLVEAVDQDKAVESVDMEKLKGSVDGTKVDYKKAYDSVDKKKAADSVDMDKVKAALGTDASDAAKDAAKAASDGG
jgi:hypothetical protein